MRLEYFQMVDRITSLDTHSRTITTSCLVPDHSPVFEGHFPGHPILPGVLMIETMAQTGGWLILALQRFARMPFLIQVEKAKMRSFVLPGERLAVSVELLHEGSGYAVVRGSIVSHGPPSSEEAVDSESKPALHGKKVAEAEIRFGVVAFPSDDLKHAMLQTAHRVGVPEHFFHAG
jgi:3-hydroxyacyl-[acyl-carrier-protein] dehydratase